MDRVWVKSSRNDSVKQVPRSALRVLSVAGWKELTKAEVDAQERKNARRPAGKDAAVASPSRPAAVGRQDDTKKETS